MKDRKKMSAKERNWLEKVYKPEVKAENEYYDEQKRRREEIEAKQPAWSICRDGHRWFWSVWAMREDSEHSKSGFAATAEEAATAAKKVAGTPSTRLNASAAAQALKHLSTRSKFHQTGLFVYSIIWTCSPGTSRRSEDTVGRIALPPCHRDGG